MQSLEKLNLSHNNLSGSISRCFEEMHWLSCIDISYNELQGLIPNSTAFRDAPMLALQGNKRLCGDIKRLPSCKAFESHKQSLKKIWVVIVFPLLGTVALLISLIGLFFNFRQRKNGSQTQQSSPRNTLGLLSVLTFDGKIVHEEIIRATNNFVMGIVLEMVDKEVFTKLSYQLEKLWPSRNFIHHFQVRWHVSKSS